MDYLKKYSDQLVLGLLLLLAIVCGVASCMPETASATSETLDRARFVGVATHKVAGKTLVVVCDTQSGTEYVITTWVGFNAAGLGMTPLGTPCGKVAR